MHSYLQSAWALAQNKPKFFNTSAMVLAMKLPDLLLLSPLSSSLISMVKSRQYITFLTQSAVFICKHA